MKVLVTGARGFVGKNLCVSLMNIRDGKDKREKYQALMPLEIYEYDIDSTQEELDACCEDCDFVFNLAGVNRPKNQEEFMEGNFGFASTLLRTLEAHGNTCPVMLSSSVQASLEGRFADSEYGKSKLAGERLFREYAERTGAHVLIYRFPNIYGKWCRPNYNSAVATFCYNIANGLPITVNDPSTELDLLYIDDLVAEMLAALLGEEHRCGYQGVTPVPGGDGEFCYCPEWDHVTLGHIVDLLGEFKASRSNLYVPDVTPGSFSKKLHSTYLSYIDASNLAYALDKKEDERGAFVEFLRTVDRGQISINVNKPGAVKGQHWHHTKWEKFLVVSGEGLVQERRIGLDEDGRPYPVTEYRVCGEKPRVVEMVPGYTHNLINLSDDNELVTVIWANEAFDPLAPDTYREEV